MQLAPLHREACDAVTFHAKDLAISAGVVVDAAGVERTNPGGPDVLYGEDKQETATVRGRGVSTRVSQCLRA
jgi:hypothetical protein